MSGSPSDPKQAAPGPEAKGSFDCEACIKLFVAIGRGRHSGLLEVRAGRVRRHLYFLGGQPVAYHSNASQDELGQSLVAARLLTKGDVRKIRERMTRGESLEDGLLSSDLITKAKLAKHQRRSIRLGIVNFLRTASGTWSYRPAPNLHPSHVDPALLAENAGLHVLWNGARRQVSIDEVLPEVTASGNLQIGDSFHEVFPLLRVEESLSGMADAVGDGCSAEDIFRAIPDRSGDLAKLIWFLVAAGLLVRSDQPYHGLEQELAQAADEARHSGQDVLTTTRSAPLEAPQAHPADTAKPVKEQLRPLSAEEVRDEHAARMHQSFYAFLDLADGSSIPAVDMRCKLLAQQWRIETRADELPEDAQKLLHQLLHGLQIVWQTLTKDERKKEYDRRLDLGQAPRVEDIRSALENPLARAQGPSMQERMPPQERASQLISRGEYSSAIPILEKLRRDNPSSASIMADLGWARWRLQGPDGSGSEDPEEFIRLALSFEPRNAKALEYHARIAMERGDRDQMLARLKRLLAVVPEAGWAQDALESKQLEASNAAPSRGLRFWRRGKS